MGLAETFETFIRFTKSKTPKFPKRDLNTNPLKNVIIIGGGAAGFFAAIHCAEKNPDYQVTILEKSSSVLNKVKISGGGRCNVTHACYEAKELVKHYPRGEKQLLGAFTKFNPSHTIDWFEQRGVEIKREDDGRMFPVSDSSQTIIDCFLSEVKRVGVQVKMQTGIEKMQTANGKWQINTSTNKTLEADAVIVTTGSSHSVWTLLEKLGHKIIAPAPSLFTFKINDERIQGLQGLAVPEAVVKICQSQSTFGISPSALLVTHTGLSGPAVLRLSAWGARELAALNHQFGIEVNWVNKDLNTVRETLKLFRQNHPKKGVATSPLFGVPKRLWERIINYQLLMTNEHLKAKPVISNPGNSNLNYADLSNQHIESIARELTAARFKVSGKSTFKDEFVTAGGVDLAEVDFRTMQSKIVPNLYFAGEVLDIDAITGGFNFQAAWTTAFIASQTI